MSPVLRLALGLLLLLGSAARSPAQTLDAENFVLGQVARLDLAGAPPFASVLWLYSLQGAGAGTCYPSVNLCLGIEEPVTLAAIGSASGAGEASYLVYVPPSLPLLDLHLQAVTLDYSSGVSLLASNVVSTTLAEVSAYDDAFDGGSLDAQWQILNPAAAQVTVGGGQLVLEPILSGPAATWFDDGEGVFVHREITGDFSVTATVRSSSPADPMLPPPPAYRLGGLLVRDPGGTPGNRNSAHVAFGSGPANNPVGVEHKTTTASVSSFTIVPTAEAAGQLRITRSGAMIGLHHRGDASQPWTTLATYAHPEFPPTVQVGMMSYSFGVPAQIVTRFDEVVFEAN
ncbi:MAG: hypothetical protein R3F20_03595 [Planctomycetota bacterium]